MKHQKCYKYKLRPTQEQEKMFLLFAASRRHVYNWALQMRKEHYARTKDTAEKKSLSPFDLNKMLTVYKRQEGNEWLNESCTALLQEAIRDLDRAFKAFFKRQARFPRFRSRKNTLPSFRFPLNVKIVEGGVSIPKVGVVKCRVDRVPPTETKTATIRQDVDGLWYVTFVTEFETPDVEPTCDSPVGIDMGLNTFVTLSTGEKIEHDKFYRRAQRKIARLGRKLSRCVKGSKGYAKAKQILAKAHKKVRNQRDAFQHDLSAKLVRAHDVICVESLNVQAMKRRARRLGKSIGDAGISAFLFKLDYKTRFANRRTVHVDRFFRSTRRCSECGTDVELSLSDRAWECAECGAQHDRDINAARNILIEGLRVLA